MAEFEADIEAELEAQSSVGQQEHEASADIQEGPGPEPEADQEVVPPESAATAVDVPGDGALQQQSDLSDTKCCICQQPLRGGGLPAQVLEATECGHVHHKVCLEKLVELSELPWTLPIQVPTQYFHPVPGKCCSCISCWSIGPVGCWTCH